MMDRPQNETRFQVELEEARKAGGWIPWACAVLAIGWWAGAAAYVIGKIGVPTIMAMPYAELGGAFALAFAPGMALIMAGFMGRESVRSSEANELVLKSVSTLLSPARGSMDEIRSLSEAVRLATSDINQHISDAEERLHSLKADLEDSAASTLKAAEVVRADAEAMRSGLARERDDLTNLNEDLRKQLDALSETLPRHAEKIVRSAEMAHQEMRTAGSGLDDRLNTIEETGKALATRVSQLDQMTADTRKRAQNLVSALVSINEQLLGSSRTVDNAVKAGDLAVEASRTTADAIKNAMDSALDGARETVDKIQLQAESAKLDAERAIDRLNDAAARAELSVRSATDAVNQHAESTERRMDQMSARMYESASRATNAAEAGLERARSRIERASSLLNGLDDDGAATPTQPQTISPRIVTPERGSDTPETAPPLAASPSAPATDSYARPSPNSSAGLGAGLATQGLDEDLLDPAPVPPPTSQGHQRLSIQSLMPFDPLEPEDEDDDLGTLTGDDDLSANAEERDFGGKPVASASNPSASDDMQQVDIGEGSADNMSWRDLLSGIDEPDTRHETALAFVDQLGRHGIRLKRAIRSADLRRIATAANRGDRHRRRATQQAAPGELQQIDRLLKQHQDLRVAAESYLAIEQPDALKVLSTAERARDDAGPRLAAFLLLDAALSR